MTTDKRDELVRQVAEKYFRDTNNGLFVVTAQVAFSEMYSLARAETLEEAAKAIKDVGRRWPIASAENCGAFACFTAVRALAPRYAETPATSCAAEAPTAPHPKDSGTQ